MNVRPRTTTVWRYFVGIIRRTVFLFGGVALYIRDILAEDVRDMVRHGRLFGGIASILVGALSFASDRYCDGSAAAYYTCTRPATYYYYPWWAILLIVLGSLSVALWFLRRKHS